MQVRLADGELDVTDLGCRDAPVVVLLHGFPQTPHCWRHVAPRLADAGMRVLLPALRGAAPGVRPRDDAAYALARTVDDVRAVLDAADAESAHLAGHDWGGLVAWAAAARLPARVLSLTALSTPHPRALADAVQKDPDQQARSSYVERLAAPDGAAALLADDAAVLRAVLAGSGAAEHYVRELSAPGALHAFLGLYRALSWAELAQVGDARVPTVFLHGDGDDVFGPEAVRRTTDLLRPPSRAVRVVGGGHWLPEQQHDVVVREVLALVARSQAAQGDDERDCEDSAQRQARL